MSEWMLAERRLSISELARQEGVSIPTVWRWTKRGIRGVALETFTLGGRRFTTAEAFRRWFLATQAEQSTAPRSETRLSRQAAIRAAELEADAAGV